jgi:hypothetical protein
VLVEQAQIRDLAALQGWIAWRTDPLLDIPSRDQDPDPGTRKRRLREAFDRAERWPPRLFTDEADAILGTPEGTLALLAVILRKQQPELADDELVRLAVDATPEEWRQVERIFFGTHPADEILREIDPEWFEDQGTPDWPAIFEDISQARNWTYQQIGELYLSQVECIRSGGEKKDWSKDLPPGLDPDGRAAYLAAQKAKWYDPDELDPTTSGSPPDGGASAQEENQADTKDDRSDGLGPKHPQEDARPDHH